MKGSRHDIRKPDVDAATPNPGELNTPGGGGGVAYARTLDRVLGYCVDSVIVTVLIIAVVTLGSVIMGPAVRFDPVPDELSGSTDVGAMRMLVDVLIATVVSAVYFVGSWVKGGASLGQRLVRIRVRGSDPDGTPTMSAAVVRWLALGVPFSIAAAVAAGSAVATVVIWSAAALWLLVILVTTARSRTGQGIHDRLAGTVVTKANARRAGTARQA